MPESETNTVQPLVVGSRRIGPGEPVFVIAEIGLNHQGKVETAKQLIDAAAAAGADAAKFQKRSLPDLYDAELLANPNLGEQKFQYLLPLLKEFELSIEQLRELQAYCTEKEMLFFATPFDLPSADQLTSLNVPLYKIGSPDLTNLPLLEHVARKGKPILMSTGMAEESEIDVSVQLLRRLNVPFGLFHVNSTYPAPFDEINLRFMDRLREYGVPVGYSGHERGIAVALAAVSRGATMIERHITLDRALEGPDHKASLLPDEFAQMVQGIRQIEQAMGSGQRRITRVEVMNREALAKSVVAVRAIRKGETITREMLTVRSPAKGLSPQRLNELVGTVARRDYVAGERFTHADLDEETRPVFDPRGIPFRWAPVVRFHDFEQWLPYHPPAFEFHLTDKDLDQPVPSGTYAQELIVHAPEYRFRSLVDLASPDQDARARSVESLRRTVEKTRDLGPHFSGVPKLVVHPGGYSLTPHPRPQEFLSLLADSLAQVEFSGMELLLENLPPRPWFFGGEWVQNIFLHAEETKAFLDAHGLKMCLDTSHAQLACNAAKTSLIEFCRTLRPYVRHLHLSDAEGIGEEGLQIGEGDVDWKAVLEVFRDYDGTITPEIWQGHLDGGKGFLLALERLAPYFAQLKERVLTRP
ncbi:MAG: N-acetylneuraminate synthase family protein [bacterium]|nr:N-acetylneuraminate synthase family protein [bacterium]